MISPEHTDTERLPGRRSFRLLASEIYFAHPYEMDGVRYNPVGEQMVTTDEGGKIQSIVADPDPATLSSAHAQEAERHAGDSAFVPAHVRQRMIRSFDGQTHEQLRLKRLRSALPYISTPRLRKELEAEIHGLETGSHGLETGSIDRPALRPRSARAGARPELYKFLDYVAHVAVWMAAHEFPVARPTVILAGSLLMDPRPAAAERLRKDEEDGYYLPPHANNNDPQRRDLPPTPPRPPELKIA